MDPLDPATLPRRYGGGQGNSLPGFSVSDHVLAGILVPPLKPIEVDEAGVILTGHRRRLAALLLAMPEVPVVQHTHLGEPEKRAYRLADNRLTLEGEWDEAALREEAEFMRDAGWELGAFGFTDEEIEEALGAIEPEPTGGQSDPDDVPEPGEEPLFDTAYAYPVAPRSSIVLVRRRESLGPRAR